MSALRIATRGSLLALWQAEHVRDRLAAAAPGRAVELVVIKTTGDKILDVPLAKVGGKGLFVKEIEEALRRGDADLAVHSMKDVPAELAEGLILAAISTREDPADALVSRGDLPLAALPAGAHVGTSSLRRVCQLLAVRPDLRLSPLRGNVDTRLRKLDAGDYDAIVLATAGLNRLGHGQRVSERLPPEVCLPAIGQGALGIEVRADDAETTALVRAAMHDEEAARCVGAERAFLRRLGGGCQTPIAAHARTIGGVDGDLVLAGLVGWPDGHALLRGEGRGAAADAEEIGRALANELCDRGAAEILEALTGGRRPATGNRRPATGGRRPAAGDRRPATGNRRPATGNRRRWVFCPPARRALRSRVVCRSVLVWPLVAAMLSGCGGMQRTLRSENQALRARVTELDGQVRRERRTTRDLRNRVLVLEDKLETAEVGRDRAPGRVPVLPVVTLQPAGAPAADPAGPTALPAPAEPTVSGGYDEAGVEIVYEGEAAHRSAVRPQLRLDESDVPLPAAARGNDDYDDGGDEASDGGDDLTALAPPPAAGDRLPVTNGRVPPLSAAYRRAHSAPVLPRAPAVRAPAAAETAGIDPLAEYRRYYTALRAGDHATAIAGFRDFLARWPRHDYADNAQYWLGEAYYDLRDYRAALVEFRAVVERYPDGGKTPDALLKIGYCYLSLREATAGREVLRQLVDIHPRSNAAALARRRLEELAKEPVP